MNSNWKQYIDEEFKYFEPQLHQLGFVVGEEQPHLKGERSAFRSDKLILIGHRLSDNQKVIIKVSRKPKGIFEVEEERLGRLALQEISFSYTVFNDPEQIFYQNKKGEVISITKFIDEEIRFLDRQLKDQFAIIHKALTSLEGVHVVVKSHQKEVKKFFKVYTFSDYQKEIQKNIASITTSFPELSALFSVTLDRFLSGKSRVEQFNGFLTHFDFVPHNFRVHSDKIYLLDHSSLRIGNKHEGWARLLNFCILYNRQLEEKILEYFKLNRSVEELESLYLIRLFRFIELIAHHNKIFNEGEGDLQALSRERVLFWSALLEQFLNQKPFDESLISDYKNKRDNLRSKEEKERQKILY